jgi:hypothetical protein
MATLTLNNLVAQLSTVAGAPVELTIRGDRKFTVSAEGNHVKGFEKIVAYFGKLVTFQPFEYDEEIDFTCAYFDAN